MTIPYSALKVDADEPDKKRQLQKVLGERVDKQQSEDARKHPTYHYPRTAEEWWGNVDEWWVEMLGLLLQFVRIKPYLEVMAGREPSVWFTQLKMDRDIRLRDILDNAWAGAPDAGWIHSLPGWAQLCDLCSEAGVLYDEEGKPKEVHQDGIKEAAS